jgi:hypothetical protein
MDRSQPRTAMVQALMRRAKELDGEMNGDDRTVMLACAREGQVVNVLTGPPADRRSDNAAVRDFLAQDGLKVVCGATTAEIVARQTGRKVGVDQRFLSLTTPPPYSIDGIDLVTEGAVTLNQVYNILDEDLSKASDRSATVDLASLLQACDWVRFTVGRALNPANTDLVFRKQGILSRDKVIPLIAEKLEKMGKLVEITLI